MDSLGPAHSSSYLQVEAFTDHALGDQFQTISPYARMIWSFTAKSLGNYMYGNISHLTRSAWVYQLEENKLLDALHLSVEISPEFRVDCVPFYPIMLRAQAWLRIDQLNGLICS